MKPLNVNYSSTQKQSTLSTGFMSKPSTHSNVHLSAPRASVAAASFDGNDSDDDTSPRESEVYLDVSSFAQPAFLSSNQAVW